MVRGLDRFRDQFRDFTDSYVLIGGTACSLAMEEAGRDFRVTKDLDIVLCIEALDADFVRAFWEFVRAGKYQNQEKSTGRKLFYRFYAPEDQSYPEMLELFSRAPDALSLSEDNRLTPIPVDEEAASLSAILMNDDYYHFIHEGKTELSGLSVVGPEHLILLKARAWLDMTERKSAGERVDSKDLRKHKNDVFRLYQILVPDVGIDAPDSIKKDMQRFLQAMAEDTAIDLKALGLGRTTVEAVLDDLRGIYGLDN